MKSEQELETRQATGVAHVNEDTPNPRISTATTEVLFQQQHEEPEVTSFPFVDSVDGVSNKNKKNKDKALEANEHPGHKHGAKLCMLSAMVHMRVLAQRKAKSIQELRKNPVTTRDQKKFCKAVDSDDDDSDEEDGPLSYLKNCRYLRGVKEDQELSIEDIFG